MRGKEILKTVVKVAVDAETIMDEMEAKELSRHIGIDLGQIPKFLWFFEQVHRLKLPADYTRYILKDKLIYFNTKTKTESCIHPSLYILRQYFYECLADGKRVYTYSQKQRKLLPYVEERMLRQCLGLSSKRRDAEKVNLQRDENGKMVLSKLGRVTPDVKQLIGARSYMLRMLVEKIYTKKELWGKGKRVNAYLAVLNQYKSEFRSVQPDSDGNGQTIQSLETYQRLFQEAAQYYQTSFGDLHRIPPEIMNSRNFSMSTPESIIRNAALLNISKGNIHLYWLARLMDCLPLPPNWSKQPSSMCDSYSYEPLSAAFHIHPSYIYIMAQMNRFRTLFPTLTDQRYYLNMRQMGFYDYFQRPYTVDIYGLIEKEENKDENVSDWLILEGMNNTQLSVQYYPLLSEIQIYWQSLNLKEWVPAVSPYGQIIWSSRITSRSIDYCPYKPELTNFISGIIDRTPKIQPEDLKIQLEDDTSAHIMAQCWKQSDRFLRYFIENAEKLKVDPFQVPCDISNETYFQQVFISPFDFEEGLLSPNERVPIWLQKYHAERITIDYLNRLKYGDYTEVKQRFVAYARDMVQLQEPYLLEEVNIKIKSITNHMELIAFIHFINDVDSREQRKRQWQLQNQVQEEEDIFGSDISQLTISEHEDEGDKQASEVEEEQKEEQEEILEVQKQVEEEKSEEKESEREVSERGKEEQKIEIVQQVREEYQLLKDFKKKVQIDKRLQGLRNEQLNMVLDATYRRKQKQGRYCSKKKVQRAERVCLKVKATQNKQLKINAIASHLDTPFAPSHCFDQICINEKVQTDWGGSQFTSFAEFNSQITISGNEEVQKEISARRKTKQQTVRIDTPAVVEINPEKQPETEQSLILEPIKTSKIDIKYDPVLRHIGQVSQVDGFKSVFGNRNSTTPIQPIQPIHPLKKAKSMQSIINVDRRSTVNNVDRRSNVDRKSNVDNVDRKSTVDKVDKVQSRVFSRVCLAHTVDHFLEKEAVLKRGDIITLQARKTLLSKGRGLRTFISQNY